jgi:hypothetical protein
VKDEEKDDLKLLVAAIYSDGYADSLAQLSRDLDLDDMLPDAGAAMPKALDHRMSIIDESILAYAGMIQMKAQTMREAGASVEQIHAEVHHYAQQLADRKADLITRTEYATGRNDGAKAILERSDLDYEWRFPHMELGRPGHEECDICAGIRDGAPYTKEQAESAGFPDLPHLQCDHSWTIVPKGRITRTEEFPPI